MKVVLISDTHERHRQISSPPYGDLLIHAGDFTYMGDPKAVQEFNAWLGEIKDNYTYGIVGIAGNHERTFDPNMGEYIPDMPKLLTNMVYLEDSSVEINGFKIYGSPHTPWFHYWAFNLDRGEDTIADAALIPEDTDILITHGPPFGILDNPFGRQPSVGCADLLHRILEIKPKLHVFGHIHGGYGIKLLDGIAFVNASSVNEAYNPVNTPIVVELEK